MCVGSFNLEQDSDLEKHYSLLQGVGKLGSKQDHNATKGEFGTTRFAHTKTQQSLGASQVNFFVFFFLIFLFFHVCALFFIVFVFIIYFYFGFGFFNNLCFFFQILSVCVCVSFLYIYMFVCFFSY
jgi:hypothetical protein